MDKCKKERILLTTLHTALTAGVGAAAWFISAFAAQHYGYAVPVEGLAGVSLISMLGAWFASNPMFAFSAECVAMKEATGPRPRATDTSAGAKKVFLPQARVAAATPKVRADKVSSTPVAALTVGKFFDQGRITIEVTQPEGSGTQVTVTARSLSASEFKGNGGLRSKLEAVPGIKWENPKNLGEGKRTMTGAIKSTNLGETAAKLQDTATRYAR